MNDKSLFSEFRSIPKKKHDILSNEQNIADLQELQNLEAVLEFMPGEQEGESFVYVSSPHLLARVPSVFRF